jgi:outer membrane receptor for ferric coprogen and ferric-rhodotorulic acid
VAGQLLPEVSNRTFSSLTSYNLPWKSLNGWTVGGGVNWASATNPRSNATLPTGPYTGYTVVSGFASYRFRFERVQATLQMNVNNLFDERYFHYLRDSAGVASGNYGAPRNFRLSLRVGF